MTNNKNEQIKKMVFCSILIALIFVLVFTGLGYITISGTPVAITIIHIPVLIGTIVLGKKYGIVLGFAFGLSSCLYAFITLGGNAPFTNPLLSILPRMIFGFIIFPIYSLFTKLVKNKWVSSALSFGICTFLHSVMVIFALYFVGKYNFYFFSAENPYSMNQTLLMFMLSIFTINMLLEILLAMFVGGPIAIAIDNVNKNHGESN